MRNALTKRSALMARSLIAGSEEGGHRIKGQHSRDLGKGGNRGDEFQQKTRFHHQGV